METQNPTVDPASLVCQEDFEVFLRGQNGLGDRLREAIKSQSEASSSAKPFIPISELYAIVTPEAVDAELQRVLPGLSPQDRGLIVDAVHGSPSFIKVFATLALIGRVESISSIISSNANDEILPITVGDVSHHGFPVVFSNNKTATPLECFQGWTAADVTAFEENMWLTLSPVFMPPSGATLTEFLEFPSKTPFPFLEDVFTFPDRKGGSSTVTNVNIHPAHINPGENQDWTPSYAVKRLPKARRHEWRREIEMLKKFSEQPSSNLVPLMAAWQHDDHYFLLFPWAKTDLRSWWRSNPDPASANPLSSKNVNASQWLISLCMDVSAGLEAFHKTTSGYHGDIKPENILWFPDRDNKSTGKWKIADFGLSHFSDKADGSKALERFGCTPGYRAPEYDQKNKPMGQKADVWSLACVFLESAIWCYIGMRGLRDFEAERFLDDQGGQNGDGAFWEQTLAGPTVLKPLVSKWLAELDAVFDGRLVDDDCRRPLVSICREDMLVPETEDRKPIFDVADKLRGILRLSTQSSPKLAVAAAAATPCIDFPAVPSSTDFVPYLPSLAPLDTNYTTSDIVWPNDGSHDYSTLFSYPTNAANQQYITAPEATVSSSSFFPTGPDGSSAASEENPLREYHTSPLQNPIQSPPSLSSPSKRQQQRQQQQQQKTGHSRKRAAPEESETTKQGITHSKTRKVEAPRFACPYHKFDPATYGIHDSRWRTCVGPGWTSVHRVKEHIDRKHSIPPNTCVRCLVSFARPADLRAHQRAEASCQVPDDENRVDHRVTEAQRSQMRRRPKGRSDVDAWNDIYRIVFGLSDDDDDALPPSPYCEQGVAGVEGSPSTSSPDTVTTSLEASSLFKFEDYLRNTLLPSANEEIATKIRGYFDLADMYRCHESGPTSRSPAMGSWDDTAVLSSLSSIPTSTCYNSTLSSLPSLLPDDHQVSRSDMYSTVATMPPPALDDARSKLGTGNASAFGKLGQTGDLSYLSGWDPAMLSQEDENFSRMLFHDLDQTNAASL